MIYKSGFFLTKNKTPNVHIGININLLIQHNLFVLDTHKVTKAIFNLLFGNKFDPLQPKYLAR